MYVLLVIHTLQRLRFFNLAIAKIILKNGITTFCKSFLVVRPVSGVVGSFYTSFRLQMYINEQSPHRTDGEIAREKALGPFVFLFNYLMSVVSFISTSLPFLS